MAVSARTDLPPYDGIGLPDHEADVLAKYAFTAYSYLASNTVLEVGSWLGRSTIAMAHVGATVVSVDPHVGPPVRAEGPTANEFLMNLRRYLSVPETVIPIMADFGRVAKLLKPGAFDMAFIDGAHDGVSVIRDGKAASLLLRAGSPILFHDYDVHVGVTSAVHELAKQWRQKPEVLEGTSLALLWKRI